MKWYIYVIVGFLLLRLFFNRKKLSSLVGPQWALVKHNFRETVSNKQDNNLTSSKIKK